MHRHFPVPHRLTCIGGGCRQRQSLAADRLCLDDQLLPVDVGIVLGVGNVCLGQVFQPHCLPDTGGARIHTAVGGVLVALLAAGLFVGADVVGGADCEGVFSRLQCVGDVEGEGHIAAGMVADVLSVDPHGGLIVARADMQQGMPPRTLPVRRQGDGAAVPDAVAEVCVADAGQPAFPAEGYCDGFGKGGVVLEAASFAAFRTVCPVRPCAVEIDPRGADKLRARVFGARNGSLIHRKNSFRILVLCLGTAHEERFHYTGLPLLCQSFFGRYLWVFRGQGCACVRRGLAFFAACRSCR